MPPADADTGSAGLSRLLIPEEVNPQGREKREAPEKYE